MPKNFETFIYYDNQLYTSDMNLGTPKFITKQNILLVNNNTISKIKYQY